MRREGWTGTLSEIPVGHVVRETAVSHDPKRVPWHYPPEQNPREYNHLRAGQKGKGQDED